MRAVLLEKLGRLPQMPAPEIGYRLAERVRRGLDRATSQLGREARGERLLRRTGPRPPGLDAATDFARYARQVVAPRFHLPTDEVGRRRTAMAFKRRFPDRLAALRDEAERLCAHRVELLGLGELALGVEIDWHRDPVTRRSWEVRFWTDYDLVREHGVGDPKVILELNRHQHLPRLAIAFWVLDEERYAREAVGQLLSWIAQNPPGQGVHWHSSLDVALRAVSWLWALFLLLPAKALDDRTLKTVTTSLFAQLEHVYRYPSLFSSPNTHLLGEATALYLGGLLFAECERGRKWYERGRELLEREIDRQVGSDGVHRELSPWYHCYALDFYLQAVCLGRKNGLPLAPAAVRRVESMVEALLHMARPGGALPRLGDDDGGRALTLDAASYDRVDDLLSTGAVLFGRGDFKAAAGGLRPETFWLAGADAESAFDALESAVPRSGSVSFPESGYTVLRSGWGPGDSHLLFDCGGLGSLGGGHGHADALAVTLASGGRELLIDPGTYVYNGDSAWRNYFRSTRAHNTAIVDGLDQSTPAGTFAWQRKAEARSLGHTVLGDLEHAAGEHYGYAAGPAGVVHRRHVFFARPDLWVIVDRFRGSGEHAFDLFFHLAPELLVSPPRQAPGARDVELVARDHVGGLALSFHAAFPLAVNVAAGMQDPPRGWVSRRYGEKRPATVLGVRLEAFAPASLISVISPFKSSRDPSCTVRRAGPSPDSGEPEDEAVTLKIVHGAVEELLRAGTGEGETEIEGQRCSDGIAWLRRRGEGVWNCLTGVEEREDVRHSRRP